jgi:hypothetical protein
MKFLWRGMMDDGGINNYYLVVWEEVYEGKMGWLVSFIYCKLMDIIIHIFCKEIYKINISHPIYHQLPQKSP